MAFCLNAFLPSPHFLRRLPESWRWETVAYPWAQCGPGGCALGFCESYRVRSGSTMSEGTGVGSAKVCGSRGQNPWGSSSVGFCSRPSCPPPRPDRGDSAFPPPAGNTWVRSYLPWPSGSPRYGFWWQNKASLKEDTSLRRSAVEG